MNNYRSYYYLIAALIGGIVFSVVLLFKNKPIPTVYSEEKDSQSVANKIANLTLEEKIRQLLICGYSSQDINEAIQKSLYCGNYIIFENNIKDLTLSQIQSNNETLHLQDPLTWIMIDQEGGKVSRLNDGSPAVKEMVRNDTVSTWGDNHGWLLNKLGFDINLAPVADIGSQNITIGNRSFGNSPIQVSNYIEEYLMSLQKHGVIGVIKHLPGHGRISEDTHISTGVLNYSWHDIQNYELVPFVNAADAGASVFMLGHIVIPEIDNLPASLSQKTIDRLRGFLPNGDSLIFMSDSLDMNGVNLAPKQAVIQSKQAGVDMILIPNLNEEEIFSSLLKAYQDSLLDINQLDQSVTRILTLKYQHLSTN